MKIVAFEGQGGARLGVVEGDQAVDLQAADGNAPTDLGAWLAKNNGEVKPLAELAKRAPASARKPLAGKRAKHLTASNALSCVAGYACGNEGSMREFQRKTTQWDMGKNFDRTGGFGPYFVSADEMPPGGKGLKIESRLNGQVMQSDNTDNMIFPVVEMLVYVTQGMTLEPGDIIFTGTPSGVGFARKPPVWMTNGDVCEVEIEGLGTLRGCTPTDE